MNTNNCQENCKPETCRGNNGFLIIIVLYILLAIILGSFTYSY